MKRRLSAIVAADLVGYSRLIRADEAGTLTDWKRARKEVIDPSFDRNEGRIVKLLGDGILIEFSSAVDAVNSAVEVQKEMTNWNRERPEDRQLIFRVGINLGDVVIDGDDIQGDGVNIAARLEALAEPGAICVSDAVHEQVRDRLALSFDDLGEQAVKNISRPVHVWQWTNGSDAPRALPEDHRLTLPGKPSIAILPLNDMSGDADQEWFADGISEDITTALSRNGDIFVIARNSSFTYRGKAVDIRQVGRDLGVEFVLEGSVRRVGNRVRITAQLVESEDGTHLWAEKYDRSLEDIFAVQDEITMNVAAAVGSEIRNEAAKLAGSKRDVDLGAWEKLAKATYHLARATPEDYKIGREICLHEIDENGGSAEFYGALCMGCAFELMWDLGNRPPPEIVSDGIQVGRKAIGMDANYAPGHAYLGMFYWMLGQLDDALQEGSTALALDPNNAFAYLLVGSALGYAGPENYEAAVENTSKAIRLAPRDKLLSHWMYTNLAVYAFIADKHEATIENAKTALRLEPENATALRFLAAAQAATGKTSEAKDNWDRSREVQPIDPQIYKASVYRTFKRTEDAKKYFAALKLAGAPYE